MRVMPIWVTFPSLPLIYWGERSIGKITSAIGRPMMTDECTSKKLRVSYARVLIEVDITTNLKDAINIRDLQGSKILQEVEYEWKPPFCKKCNKVGHNCEKEKTTKPQNTQRWIEKPQDAIVETGNKDKEIENKDKDTVEDNPLVGEHKCTCFHTM